MKIFGTIPVRKKKGNFKKKKKEKNYLEALSAQREGRLTITSIFPTELRSASFLPTKPLKNNHSFQ